METWEHAYEAQLARLDPDQRRIHDDALDFTTGAPRRYLAGAGSGKTATLVTIAATALNRLGLRPEDILLGTFTNAAEAEMAHRLKAMISPEHYDRMHGMAGKSRSWGVINFDKLTSRWVWHGNGRRFWPGGRLPERDLGGDRDTPSVDMLVKVIVLYTKEWIIRNGGIPGLPPGFRGYDLFDWYEHTADAPMKSDARFDGRRLGRFGWIRSRVRADGYSFANPTTREMAYRLAYQLAEQLELPKKTIDGRQVDIRTVIEMVERAKATLGAGEREDKLAVFAEHAQWRYRLAMFDECQDCNRVQILAALRICPEARFIGDVRQSIYFFRGGSPGTTLSLDRDYGARTLYLPRNYRSGRHIVEAGNLICEGHPWMIGPPSEAMRQIDGEIRFTEHSDMPRAVKAIATEIHAAVTSGERKAGDFAVLTTTNALADMAQAALDLHALPNVRLGSRAGLWDIDKNRNTRAVLAWLAITSGVAGIDPNNAVLTLAVPKLEAIGDRKLQEAAQYGDPVAWARQARGLGASQRDAIEGWLLRVEACRNIYQTFGWIGLTYALAYVLDPGGADATFTDEGRLAIGLPPDTDTSLSKEDRAVLERLEQWNEWIADITAGQTEAQAREAAKSAAQAAAAAQDGVVEEAAEPASPTLAILTTARVLGSFPALIQHALACQKNPVMPDDMPSAVAEDSSAAERWLAEVEALRASRVSISTIHGAKGLEWHTVHLCATQLQIDGRADGAESGTLPEEAEERQRILYVGATRARDVLCMHTWVVGSRGGFPHAVEHRIQPMLRMEARRRQIVQEDLPKLTTAGWTLLGEPYGTMPCNLVAHHPLDHNVQLCIRALPREIAPGELDTVNPGRAAYITPHVVELHAFRGVEVLHRAHSPADALGVLVKRAMRLQQRPPASFANMRAMRAYLEQEADGGAVEPLIPTVAPAPRSVILVQEYIAWVRAQGMVKLADMLAKMDHEEVTRVVVGMGYNPDAPCDPAVPAGPPEPPEPEKPNRSRTPRAAPSTPPTLAPTSTQPAAPPPARVTAATAVREMADVPVALADRDTFLVVPVPPRENGIVRRSIAVGLPLPPKAGHPSRLLIEGNVGGQRPMTIQVRPGAILIYTWSDQPGVVAGEAVRLQADGTMVTLLTWQGLLGDAYHPNTLLPTLADVATRLEALYGPYPAGLTTPQARAAWEVGVGTVGTLDGRAGSSWGISVPADRLGLPTPGKLTFHALGS